MTFKFMWMSARSSGTWICKRAPSRQSERRERGNSKQRACQPWEGTLMCTRVTERERERERTLILARLSVCINYPGFHFNRASATPLFTHVGLVVRHEHGEVGEVAAGAGGVRAVGVQQPAALGRPLPRHGALRVVPEGAVGSVVILYLRGGGEKNRRDDGKRVCVCVCVCEEVN